MPLVGAYAGNGLRSFPSLRSSKLRELSRELATTVSLPSVLVRDMVLVMDLEVQVTTGRSVGRQAPTMPTHISTPLQMNAGPSTSEPCQYSVTVRAKERPLQLASEFASFMCGTRQILTAQTLHKPR